MRETQGAISLRLVLGDQLSQDLSALDDADPQSDLIVMAEVMDEARYVRHHQKKIAFLFAAMRHFAEELAGRGFRVRYIRLDDDGNSGSLGGEIVRALAAFPAERLVMTEPGEYRVLKMMRHWQSELGLPVEIRPDRRFLASHRMFKQWAEGKSVLRMEYFYREMRKRYGILLDGQGQPEGGRWNYDVENRKPPDPRLAGYQRRRHPLSATTEAVLDLVASRFSDHIGQLRPFSMAVTRAQAEAERDDFIAYGLPNFGTYQDAMVTGEAFLNHSVLSAYLNAGLLDPLDLCRRAEEAYRAGLAPLNACEGFIRQILGWREYVRGIYWRAMPDYAERNALAASEPLPAFYWTGETRMACMAEAIGQTILHAYSHHIQRLMVTGNFALLAGLSPKEVCAWYLEVYADAYEWVELPNTLGMALYADGGLMASKPYAASGAYIDRMSDFCGGCAYDPKRATGDGACPFNSLYWDFLARNDEKLRGNRRLSLAYANWERFSPERKADLQAKAGAVIADMRKGVL